MISPECDDGSLSLDAAVFRNLKSIMALMNMFLFPSV